MINTIRTLALLLVLFGCGNRSDHFVEEKRTFKIDSVEYFPVGVPSVANLDPRWVIHTEVGKFTFHRAMKVGDSVTIIFLKRKPEVFDPIIEHSEIKENGADTLR